MAVDISDPGFDPKNQDPRAKPAPAAPKIPPKDKRSIKPVKVCCLTELRPWIEQTVVDEDGVEKVESRPLKKGEVTEIHEWVANLLIANEHAARV
jgi:hypothetical protein